MHGLMVRQNAANFQPSSRLLIRSRPQGMRSSRGSSSRTGQGQLNTSASPIGLASNAHPALPVSVKQALAEYLRAASSDSSDVEDNVLQQRLDSFYRVKKTAKAGKVINIARSSNLQDALRAGEATIQIPNRRNSYSLSPSMFLPAPDSASDEAFLHKLASSSTFAATARSSSAQATPLLPQNTTRLTSVGSVTRRGLAHGTPQAAAAAANQASPAEVRRAAFVPAAAPPAVPLQADRDTARANANAPQQQATAAVSSGLCGMLFGAVCWSAKAAYTTFVPTSVQRSLNKIVEDVHATAEEIHFLNRKDLNPPNAAAAVAEDGADHYPPLATPLLLGAPMPDAEPSIAEVLRQMHVMQCQFDAGMVEAAEKFAGFQKMGVALRGLVNHLLARNESCESELLQVKEDLKAIKDHQKEQELVAAGLAEKEDANAPEWDKVSDSGNYNDGAFFFGMGNPSFPEDSSVGGANEVGQGVEEGVHDEVESVGDDAYDDLPSLELCSDNEAEEAGRENEDGLIDLDAWD